MHQRHQTSGKPLSVSSGGSSESGTTTPRKGTKRRSSSSDASIAAGNLLVWLILAAGLLCGAYIFFVDFEEKHDAALRSKLGRQQSPDAKQKELEAQLAEAKADLVHAQSANAILQQQIEQGGKAAKGSSEMQVKLELLKKYKERMHQAIKKFSKKEVLEKYGPGPHKVEITVAFDPQSNVAADGPLKEVMTIELAPVDEMPHTVYWFLEQVSHGLYNGCSFHRNAGHVVQGGPAPNFQTPPGGLALAKRFKDAKLDGVLFQEYSAAHPHKKYTLGFAGRPGGPDFYVSMMDNSRNHGPGGQTSYDDPTEADPCFAHIVDGFAVADRMHKSEVAVGDYKHMKHNVAIETMKIIK